MKKLLIVSRSLEIGGAERSLISLLNSIDYLKYSVDLFLTRQIGEFLKDVPNEVNILDENDAKYLGVSIKEPVLQGKWGIVFGRLVSKIHTNLYRKFVSPGKDNHIEGTLSHLYTKRFIQKINPNNQYDLAISFLTPHYLVLEKVNAYKKIAWIHTDYSSIATDINIEKKMWEKYDYIVSISDECTHSFLSKFPTLEDKIVRIDNILSSGLIINQANEFIPTEMIRKENNEIIFCSVGRVSGAKNFDNIPEICSRLIKSGLNIKWFIIGSGGIEKLVKSKIEEFGMKNNVIMLGAKSNPYPYIKACDFYIQPSRYEGKAVTVREAQILKKPVIISRFPTSSSQLTDGYDGVIVDMDNEGCAKGIVDVINNKELVDKIVSNLYKEDYSNASEVEKIYKLMED